MHSSLATVRICFLSLICFFGPPSLLTAQNWVDPYKKAEAYLQQGNFDAALKEAKSALEIYAREGALANDNYASILRLNANVCYGAELYEEGLRFALDEIRIRESKMDPVLATAYANAAQFYKQQAKYKQAIDMLEKAVAIERQFYAPEQPELLRDRLNLAVTYYLADEREQAWSIFTDLERKITDEDEETLVNWYFFGMLKKEMGLIDDAVFFFLQLQDKFQAAGLAETAEFAFLLSGLADAYHLQRLYFKAEEAYNLAQDLFENLTLTDIDEYYQLLSSRAVNLEALGRPEEADQSLEALAQIPAAKSAYANGLANRAALNQVKGNEMQAEKFYRKALAATDTSTMVGLRSQAETEERLAVLLAKSAPDEALHLIGLSNQRLTALLGREHSRILRSHNFWGFIYASQQQWDNACQQYNRAWNLFSASRLPASQEQVVTLTGLAQCLQSKGKPDQADSIYSKAMALYNTESLPIDNAYISLCTHFAAHAQSNGNFPKAIRYLQLAVDVEKAKTKNQDTYYKLLQELAILHMRAGNLQQAKAKLDSVDSYYQSTARLDNVTYASLLLDLGRYHQLMGEYPLAEKDIRASISLYQKYAGDKSADYAYALNTLALLYQTMGNFGEAEAALLHALNIREGLNQQNTAEYSTLLQNLASLYQLQEEYGKAESFMARSLELDEQLLGNEHPQFVIGLENLATLYQKKKDYAKAIVQLEQARITIEKGAGKNHPTYATVLSNLGALYQDMGQYELSEKMWNESVALRLQMLGEDHPDYARALYGLAGVQFATGNWSKADANFTLVIEKFQQQIASYFHVLSEKEKGALYARIKPIFETYYDFCIQMAYQQKNATVMLERLYNLQLNTKAILLNASNKVRASIQQSADADLKLLYDQWQQTKENLVLLYSYSKDERTRLGIDIKVIETKANDLEKNLSERSALFNSQQNQNIITLSQVRESLKENEAAIEIIRIRKKFVSDSIYYVALMVTKKEMTPRLMVWPHGNLIENKIFKFHRNAIKFQQPDTLSYRHFWEPLVKQLPNVETLYISCDGIFNKINFNSIQYPDGKLWVLDRFNIRLVSNTRELAEKHTSESAISNTASVFGYADFNLAETDKAVAIAKRALASRYGFKGEDVPMLPATEKEVILLQQTLAHKNWNVNSFTLASATEMEIKRTDNPRILHIATHGFFLDDVDLSDELQNVDSDETRINPLFRSGLLLAGAALKQEAGQEDGVLTAYEAMNLKLDRTDLVTLSACETGLGEVRNGEGVYGLQRSFLVAGARTVMMSLWQVDDVATQELMSSFYSNWIGGIDKFDAFRKAQLSVKEKYSAPYYWGAFVIIGN